ncbi:MAG: translation elongation factor 4 [Candidatus Pacebacteria bacterium]|nr:translation elongation factor 4 [Candidatus Paceibacterota bacterium]
MDLKHIRNFSIIAHIDHGKSTLADRMLEVTGTIEARKMRDQVLDNMELERERGITIKMQPVRMEHTVGGQNFQLNLIDTPGHIDFSYEVSRALKAVEGSILLVDSTQGVQAQTLTTLEMARKEGLVIVPAVSKIDSPLARPDDVKLEIATLLDIDPDTVLEVSGRTGEGVEELLKAVIERIPPPKTEHAGEVVSTEGGLKALVFDFKYDDHRGVIVYVRVFSGSVKRHDRLLFGVAKEKFIALEVGVFMPDEEARDTIGAGEIGYIVTGVKQPGIASVGDTITTEKNPMPALAGYDNPRPVVWASIYPESQDDFPTLRMALSRLKLSDSAFTFEEESSGALGRGFRAGFLGMLHLEIITERLHREFHLELIVTTPSITYIVTKRNSDKKVTVYSPHLFPNDGEIAAVEEPWANMRIITPERYVGILMPFLYEHEGEVGETESFGEGRSAVSVTMPLRELMRGFFDELKSLTSGYASITYTIAGLRPASVTRMDIVLADEIVPAFTRVISRRRAQEEADQATEKLQTILPRQQFEMKVQGVALGKILASKTIKAFRKDVLMHGSKMVGGGDVSRKKKLLEKQKRGKAKMKASAKVNIPHDVFLKMMQRGSDN